MFNRLNRRYIFNQSIFQPARLVYRSVIPQWKDQGGGLLSGSTKPAGQKYLCHVNQHGNGNSHRQIGHTPPKSTGYKGFHVPQHKTHAIFAVPLGSAYLGLIVLYRLYLFFNHGSQWHACFCKHVTGIVMVCVTCQEMHQAPVWLWEMFWEVPPLYNCVCAFEISCDLRGIRAGYEDRNTYVAKYCNIDNKNDGV